MLTSIWFSLTHYYLSFWVHEMSEMARLRIILDAVYGSSIVCMSTSSFSQRVRNTHVWYTWCAFSCIPPKMSKMEMDQAPQHRKKRDGLKSVREQEQKAHTHTNTTKTIVENRVDIAFIFVFDVFLLLCTCMRLRIKSKIFINLNTLFHRNIRIYAFSQNRWISSTVCFFLLYFFRFFPSLFRPIFSLSSKI